MTYRAVPSGVNAARVPTPENELTTTPVDGVTNDTVFRSGSVTTTWVLLGSAASTWPCRARFVLVTLLPPVENVMSPLVEPRKMDAPF